MVSYDEDNMVWTFITLVEGSQQGITYEVDDAYVPDEVRIRRTATAMV